MLFSVLYCLQAFFFSLFQYGILIGIGISLLILLYPLARPNMTVSSSCIMHVYLGNTVYSYNQRMKGNLDLILKDNYHLRVIYCMLP